MSEAFQPTLLYFLETVNPGVPDGTMIDEISGRPSALRPVTAVTVTRAVMSVPELVMKHLVPLITHSPVASSSLAVVRVPPASEPQSGSVSPNAPSASPEVRRGSHSRFCSSVPKRKIGMAPSPTPASRVIAIEESTRASSSRARQKAK